MLSEPTNWAWHPSATAEATSIWSRNVAEEMPGNVLQPSFCSWWSSAFQQDIVILDIDLGGPRSVDYISIFWGDDGGRIRPFSRTFSVECNRGREAPSCRAARHALIMDKKWQRDSGWMVVYEVVNHSTPFKRSTVDR